MPLAETSAVNHPDDTIVAISSARGPGRRAIVRVSGPGTCTIIDAVFTASRTDTVTRRAQRLIPGIVRLRGVLSPVPASLYFFTGPRTYTGQDLAELHTVGSPPLVEQLVADLLSAGARPARPGEFTLRAFLAGKKDLTQAEAVQAVVEAGNDADLRRALTYLAGGVARPLHALRDDLLDLLADLEAALDFADEDIEFISASKMRMRIDAALDQLNRLQRQLEERTVSGRPVRVVLAGRPNAGKTSLFNALAGSDALVSPIPGTTRDYLTKRIDLGGIAAELIDTAGWHVAADTIDELAQRLGGEQTSQADVIVWCVESAGVLDAAEDTRLRATGATVLRVMTKSDLVVTSDASALGASVVTPGGLDGLQTALAAAVSSLAQSSLSPSQSRCRRHVAASIAELSLARELTARNDPPELVAASLRTVIDQIGEMTGAIYTNDLLDRIFSHFCIGK